MTNDEMKQIIAVNCHIPVELLNGETPEENLIRARALIAYKRDGVHGLEYPTKKSTKEQFAEWFGGDQAKQSDIDQAFTNLREIENNYRAPYPAMKDGGEVPAIPEEQESNAEKFGKWVQANMTRSYSDLW